MRKYFIAAALLFSLLLSLNSISQGGFATVTGSVSDSTGALIPGVMVKVTAVDIAVVTATLSDKA